MTVSMTYIHECLYCGNSLEDKREDAQFCGDNCRKKFNRKNNTVVDRASPEPRDEKIVTQWGVLLCDSKTAKWFGEREL